MAAIHRFEQAVILEKAIILNGILLNGTQEEKKRAKAEWEILIEEGKRQLLYLKDNKIDLKQNLR